MSVRHFESVKVAFKNFDGHTVEYFTKGSRYFGIIIPNDLVTDMLVEGWNVKFNESTNEYFMLVKIISEYDEDLSYLQTLGGLEVELFVEGIPVPEVIGDHMTALLISITPKQ